MVFWVWLHGWDRDLLVHVFSFLGILSFIHLWYVPKLAVRAKGNYLSKEHQLGQCSVMEDKDCLFLKWLLHLSDRRLKSQAFESLTVSKNQSVFLLFKPQKTQTINRPLKKLIFSESDIYLKRQRWTNYRSLVWSKRAFLCSVHEPFKFGHVQINTENSLKFKITHRWWGLMCVVTRCGSSCAHCRNINGVFNCFWLKSVGWVWVKPIRRLEETVKDCLRKRALTFW